MAGGWAQASPVLAHVRDALRRWTSHQQGWVGATAPDGPPTVGRLVAIAAHVGPLWWTNACRVVAVIDEPDRYGFSYGTLQGHAEQGEARFLIERTPDEAVVYDIRYPFATETCLGPTRVSADPLVSAPFRVALLRHCNGQSIGRNSRPTVGFYIATQGNPRFWIRYSLISCLGRISLLLAYPRRAGLGSLFWGMAMVTKSVAKLRAGMLIGVACVLLTSSLGCQETAQFRF
ncbi:MAG: DUF1990 domain-containing protein [Pirellulales bacterium]